MKRCPSCQSVYTDDTLRYCLQDGATLRTLTGAQSQSSDETLRETTVEQARSAEAAPTEILDHRSMPTAKINSPVTTVDQSPPATAEMRAPSPASQASPAVPPSPNRLLTTGVFAIALLLLALLGVGLTLLMRDRANVTTGNDSRVAKPEADTNRNAGANTNAGANANATRKPQPLTLTASASSTRSPYQGISYPPANALDGVASTAWIEGAAGSGVGEWIQCDFGGERALRKMVIWPGYFKDARIWVRNNRVAVAAINFSDGTSREVRFPDRMEKQTIDLESVKTNWVRIVIKEVYKGSDPDTAISELSFEME